MKTRKMFLDEIMDHFRADEDVNAALDDFASAHHNGLNPTGEHLLSQIRFKMDRLKHREIEVEEAVEYDDAG
jgi:hypothetical protein